MLISEAIAQSTALTGQVVDNSVLVRWLSEIDGRLAFEFYRTGAWTPYDPTDDLGSELLVPFPWDGFYVHHLEALIYFSDGEYDRYDNARTLSEKTLADFRSFMQRTQAKICGCGFPTEKTGGTYVTVIPEQAESVWFWISAYSLAIKHGFSGTEEEWLESLVGPPGAKGDPYTVLGLYATLADLETAHPTGEKGDAYAVGTAEENTTYNWDVDAEAWVDIGPLRGEKGEDGLPGKDGKDGQDGKDGTSFVIKGMYATYAALIAAHPTGSAGDAYAVGTAESNAVYLWDVDLSAWVNIGSIKGPAGENGVGIASITKTGTSGNVDTYTVTFTNGTTTTYTVTNGTDGSPGPNQVTSATATNLTGMLKGNGNTVGTATPGVDFGTYSKPSGGIPASDLAPALIPLPFTVTLLAASWANDAQTVSNANFIANGFDYILNPTSASRSDFLAAQIYADDVTVDGSMTFHCATAPASDISMKVLRIATS